MDPFPVCLDPGITAPPVGEPAGGNIAVHDRTGWFSGKRLRARWFSRRIVFAARVLRPAA